MNLKIILTDKDTNVRLLFVFFALLLSFNIDKASAFGISIDDSNKQDESKKNDVKVFYNENRDCVNGSCRVNKNYAKIGIEDYSQSNPWRRFYAGIDINWIVQKFGSGNDKTMHSHNFWRRFQNLDVYAGIRAYRFLGAEIGYTHFGNVRAKTNRKMDLDGAFISIIGYTPHISIMEITSLEGYISAGGALLFNTTNGGSPMASSKFGVGIIGKVYGSLAVNVGVDYYYPNNRFSKDGFLTFKTGFNIYLSL